MKTCGCLPGTEENGWHEIRSPECTRAESEAFGRAIERALKEIRRRGLRKVRGTP